jgi:hypothetical protein
MTEIPVIVYGLPPGAPRNRGETKMGAEAAFSIRNVSADKLRSSFEDLVKALGSSLTMPDSIGSFEVAALDIELELTAEGQIGLLGTGGKLGGKGSLTLRLKRPEKHAK